jgi:hypothetical protein
VTAVTKIFFRTIVQVPVAHPVTHENLEFWLQVAIGIGFLYSLQLPISIAIPMRIPMRIPMPNGIEDCFIFEAA